MKHFTALEQFPTQLPFPVVTIGNFDGVHLGHQQILQMVVEEARANHGSSVVITFNPHPLQILLPDSAPPLIMTPAQKLDILEERGIDCVLELPFDEVLARWSPRHFVERILVNAVGSRRVYVGSNFVFGYQQRGTIETLQTLGNGLGFRVEGIPQWTWRRTRVSSTLIRGLVLEGQVTDANRLLGRSFTLQGSVVEGTARGRHLTVPTLNLAPVNELIPRNGVYITRTSFEGLSFPSVTNIGIRPTFGGEGVSIESFLIDVKELETPRALSVAFLYRLRDERKFATAADLKIQIEGDVLRARRYFRRLERFVAPDKGKRQTG